MKQNYKANPLDISSNYSPIYNTEVCKTSINKSTNIHISYDNRSNIYVQNDYNPYKKYTNNLIFSKNRELYPSINSQANQNDYYDRQNYNNDRFSESYDNREYLLSPINRSNNRNIFNGNQNKYQNNNNYDNNNDTDRNKGNYTYYESKYSRKKSIEKDNNFNNNNFNEIVYYNENYNISNISVKNNKNDSNYNIKTNEDNSNIKKSKNSMIYSKKQNEKLKISSNSNINNDTIDKIKNNCNYPNSNNTHLDASKDSYHSPLKTVTVEKGTYNVHDKNNYSRNEKKESSRSSDKIQVNTGILKIKNEIKNKNKKIEMIKLNKNLIGLKKTSNIKKIPFSPIERKKSLNDHKELNLIKEKKQKISNNYSYSEIKPKENKKIFQSDYLEKKDKKGLSVIKGIKLTNNKLFKKSISAYISQTLENSPDISKNKNNINKIVPASLDNEDNNKIINISHSSISNHKDNEETGKKTHNIVLSNLKKGRRRSEVINDNKDDQSVRRLHSHQKLNIYLEFNNEKLKPRSSKILPTFKNNLVEYNNLEHSQRYINDNILNHMKNRNNNSIFNSKTYNKYNNYTEVKKSIKNKGNNTLHKIALNRIKPSNLDNIHLLTLNPNNSNLTRKLKNPMKIQNQTKEKLKFVENEEEDNWDDIEFLGLRKKTYDIGQRQRKNKNSKLKSQTSFIKSCESLSIPGRNDEGNKKINQDSYIIERNINGIVNFNIFAVLDGHGENGHYASQFVSRYMITHIKNHPLLKK